MRIAFLCFEAFQNGGIRTYTHELLNGIAAAGHSVVLFAPQPPPEMSAGSDSTVVVRTVRVPPLPLMSAPTFGLRLPWAFHKAEKEDGRFDIVHSNTYSDVLLRRSAVRGIRVSTVYHLGTSTARSMESSLFDMLSHPTREYGPGLAFEGLCLRRADHLIAVSGFTRTDVLRAYPDIDPSRISVIYLGARRRTLAAGSDVMERAKEHWRIGENDRVLLYVGRMEERKGTTLLMNAFGLLDSQANAKLLLVGSGRTSGYEHLAMKLGIADRVVFAGFVDDTLLSVAYSLATALVHPASIEGFGLTIADALASGLPVVATRVGSIPELVREGIDGYLSEPGNPRAFAYAIRRTLEMKDAFRSEEGSHLLTRFTWEKTVRETLSLYERLLSSRNER